MNAKKQDGKGLSGFVLGLLLATLVIAGVLFFLNQSNKRVFKEEVQKELPPPPEVLVPQGSSAASTSQMPASGEHASSDVLGDFIEEQQASETPSDRLPAIVPPRAERPAKPAAKPAEKKAAPKPATKPSPEQILESGNIEKARKEAQSEKAKQKAESKAAASSGGHAIVQMGSFGDRQSAESHRAKLAMMGVSSNVAEATVNGQSVYRVESGRLSTADAERTRKTLQENNVNSFTRSVK